MPKILYIEDELTQNIATIKRYFSPILRNNRILMTLNDLENSDQVYPEDVVQACSPSSTLDISYTFPMALERIINNHKSYDLMLIDRNISKHQYIDEFEQIRMTLREKVNLDYDDDKLLSFYEREGDLLLLVLLRLNPEYRNKVYYLTANTMDDLRGSMELQTLMDLDAFQREHIIEKGSQQEEQISGIITRMDQFTIQTTYDRQCKILQKYLSEDSLGLFFDIISNYRRRKDKEFVMLLRNLLENILLRVALAINDRQADYWCESNPEQLSIRKFIGRKNGNYRTGLIKIDRMMKFKYYPVVYNACLSIYEITSECGVHGTDPSLTADSTKIHDFTYYTVETMLNQIMEIIVWFDKAMEKFRI